LNLWRDDKLLAGRCYLLILLALPLCLPSLVHAERLPEHRYTTIDGLPNDAVTRILSDSHGFLWMCTSFGLSRFDGREFVNYTTENGLPSRMVRDIVENPDGSYYVAVWINRIARFDPSTSDRSQLFEPIPVGPQGTRVVRLLRGREGRLWAGTTAGLYVMADDPEKRTFELVPLGVGQHVRPRIWDLAEDRDGTLWIATSTGLIRRTADGSVSVRSIVPGVDEVETYTVMADSEGRIWIGHNGGVTVFKPGDIRFVTGLEGASSQGVVPLVSPGDTAWYGEPDIGNGLVSALLQTGDGMIWLAMVKGGLTTFDGTRSLHYKPGVALSAFQSRALAEDQEGNVWIGSLDRGVTRLARTGIISFDETDGLKFSSNATIEEDSRGRIAVIAGTAVYRFDDERFQAIHPPFLTDHTSGRTGANASALLDRAGRWWFGTTHGLYRFPAGSRLEQLETVPPEVVYTSRNGLPSSAVTAIYEDSIGDIWIGTGEPGVLVRWSSADNTLRTYTVTDGVITSLATSFVQDYDGNLWVGFGSGLTRYRAGRFSPFLMEDGANFDLRVRQILLDRKGRLWVATVKYGVYRIDDPTADVPHAIRFTSREGLASDDVNCIVEDRWGRLWFGTTAGLSRFDPETEKVNTLTTRHGLSNNYAWKALSDSSDTLWFSSRRGLSHIIPQVETPDPEPPNVRITTLRIAGTRHPVSELGEREILGLRIAPNRNRVEIDFGSIAFDLDADHHYQYRLEGTDEPWSRATTHRRVNYSSLAPGDYRFVVRATNAWGKFGPEASVAFEVLRPFWQQWWFLLSGFVLATSVVYAAHRYKLSRVIELERVRTRIATDLHDDVGSSLSQISILSEVVHRRLKGDEPGLTGPLARIAQVSRQLVDSMSDIVWATNPKFDRLSDLVHRMRRFGSDTLEASDIEFSFHAPPERKRSRLGVDTRRQVYLVFKEAIHNAVRHSGCTQMKIDFQVEHERLLLRLEDNGSGISSDGQTGQGLASMQRRAQSLGGVLRIDSVPGEGTTIMLEAPLHSRRRFARS
jgi:ligand-binding sensor domain-containing protein/signal transduction histidine kinase